MAEQEKGTKQRTASRRIMHIVCVIAIYVLIYGLLLYAVIFLCQKGYRFCYEIFGPTVVQEDSGEEKAFQVWKEDTMKSVSRRLYEEGLIVSQKSFYVRTQLMSPNEKELRPGIYLLRTDMRYEEIINQLTASEGITP